VGAAGLVLAPVVVAIWVLPWFVTQDGPAHVYNAHVLLDLAQRGEASPYAWAYEARWQPLPNWAGHLALMGLMTVGPARVADRVLMTATLVLPVWMVLRLCRRVFGREPGAEIGLGAAALALNFLWLLGFYSFLLGVAVMLATWSHAWRGWSSGRMGWGWAAGLAGWVVVGYGCHPVSLGLMAMGLLVVGVLGGAEGRGRRLLWTVVGLLPLGPLGLVYRALMTGGGEIRPIWANLQGETWLAAVLNQVIWIDPISVAKRDRVPGLGWTGNWAGLLAPVVWLGLGLGAVVIGRQPRRGTPGLAWLVFGGVLLASGLAAPDTVGPGHGNYLGQRVAWAGLLGILVGVAGAEVRRGAWWVRAGGIALGVAGLLQAITVVEYGVETDRRVGAYLAAGERLEAERRIAGLVLNGVSAFRANGLWHADTLLGVGTGRVVWSNYESGHYYFPVRIRRGVKHPPAEVFEWVSRLDAPEEQGERVALWSRVLERYGSEIDGLVIWGRDEAVEAVTRRWFEPVGEPGPARAWRKVVRAAGEALPERPPGEIERNEKGLRNFRTERTVVGEKRS
jgi:hypothetical protein